MNTKTIESNAGELPAAVRSVGAMMAFQSEGIGLVTSGRQNLPAETSRQSFQTFPDGPALWQLYQQQAGSDVENDLVECYLPLVHSILNRLAGTLPKNVDHDDLCSAGVLGLLSALRKFNPAIGVPFYGYARQRIRGAMLDEMRHMDWVPRAIHAKARELQNVVYQLEKQLGRTPTRFEKAEAMKMTVAEFDELLEELRPVQFLRMDAAGKNEQGDDDFHPETIVDPNQIDPMEQASLLELRRVIFERLQQMPEMQRKVLTLYFVEDMTLREIGEVLGLTEGRICQIQSHAISSLRKYLMLYESDMASLNELAAPKNQRGEKQRVVHIQADTGHSDSKICPVVNWRVA